MLKIVDLEKTKSTFKACGDYEQHEGILVTKQLVTESYNYLENYNIVYTNTQQKEIRFTVKIENSCRKEFIRRANEEMQGDEQLDFVSTEL